MSKVKCDSPYIRKSKLIHCIKRKETFHKKNDRIKRANNNEYVTGYYISEDGTLKRHHKRTKYIRKDIETKVRHHSDNLYNRGLYRKIRNAKDEIW